MGIKTDEFRAEASPSPVLSLPKQRSPTFFRINAIALRPWSTYNAFIMRFLDFRVSVSRDRGTGQVVAEIPALGIADYGKDLPAALDHLEEMLRFHLDCLRKEGKSIPKERQTKEGLYLRVKLPAHAA